MKALKCNAWLRGSLRFLAIALIGFMLEPGIVNATTGGTPDSSPSCEDMLAVSQLRGIKSVLVDSDFNSPGSAGGSGFKRDSELSLIDLLHEDPAQNLVMQAPLMAMSSAQRMLAMWYSAGVEERRSAYHGLVRYFKFFMDGLPVTSGFRFVGNPQVISSFVEVVEAQARGDRSAASVPIFIGPHGGGKSEILNTNRAGARNLSSDDSGQFRMYSGSFIHLDQISGLGRLAEKENLRDANGNNLVNALARPFALSDSLLTILPPSIQQRILKMVRPKVSEMLSELKGNFVDPVLKPDPQTQKIIDTIFTHYERKLGHPLSDSEKVAALNKHIEVRRVHLGVDGQMPLIEAQGPDIDVAGLFMTPNPVIRAVSALGPADVFAWYLNGKFLKGHGNMILLDEWPRNPKDFMDMVLGAFQNRSLSVGGAPEIPFDAVITAAGNLASINKMREDAAQAAALDRFRKIYTVWSTIPQEIAQTLAYFQKDGLYMQKIAGEEESPWEQADLNVLFPMVESLESGKVLGSDYRYRLRVGHGPGAVEISPHTLRFMAYVISATRQENDPRKAAEKLTTAFVMNPVYRDPLMRIRFYEGEASLGATEFRELKNLTTKLEEGNSGISMRDGGRWLTEVLNAARRPGNNNTATPGLALAVFRKMMHTREIEHASHREGLLWEQRAMMVVDGLLIDKISSDINSAMAQQERAVKTAYWEIMTEMGAIYEDPRATEYISSRTNQAKPIDMERMKFIQEWWQRKNGVPLDVAKIALFHARRVKSEGTESDEPHPELLKAISDYYAGMVTKLANIDDLVQVATTGEGRQESRELLESALRNLRALGYNETAAMAALQLKKERDNRLSQVEQR